MNRNRKPHICPVLLALCLLTLVLILTACTNLTHTGTPFHRTP